VKGGVGHANDRKESDGDHNTFEGSLMKDLSCVLALFRSAYDLATDTTQTIVVHNPIKEATNQPEERSHERSE
jgi:hypothetical protein